MSDVKTIAEKAELIYAKNNNTPLFAIVAENRFNAGDTETAKEILEKGIRQFPDYATPRYIYAKILIAEGDKELAKEKLKEARKLFTAPVLETYFEKLLSDKTSLLGEGEPDPILQELNEEILPEKENDGADEEDFVSETLATVYENQGAYEEAVEVYEKLMEKEPENASKYEKKIAELKQRSKK